MNNKVIKIHMKMLEPEFPLSVVLMVIGIMLSGFPIISLIAIVIIIVLFCRGINKIFRTSLVREDGEILMTLPITSSQLIFGKIATLVIWCTAFMIALILSFTLFTVFTGMLEEGMVLYMESLLAPYAKGITVLEGGIIGVLLIIESLMVSANLGLFCLFFQLNKSSSRKRAGAYSVGMLIVSFILSMGFTTVLSLGSSQLIELGLRSTFAIILEMLIEGGIAVLLFKCCKNRLENSYDLISE